jgi:hypothetical protein
MDDMLWTRALGVMLMLVGWLTLPGCSRKVLPPEDDESPDGPPRTPLAVQTILSLSCALVDCHAGPYAAAGMNLSADSSYSHLVNIPSASCDQMARVRPFVPDSSCVIKRLSGEVNPRMPLGGSITVAEQATIRAWIEQGAPPAGPPPSYPVRRRVPSAP